MVSDITNKYEVHVLFGKTIPTASSPSTSPCPAAAAVKVEAMVKAVERWSSSVGRGEIFGLDFVKGNRRRGSKLYRSMLIGDTSQCEVGQPGDVQEEGDQVAGQVAKLVVGLSCCEKPAYLGCSFQGGLDSHQLIGGVARGAGGL